MKCPVCDRGSLRVEAEVLGLYRCETCTTVTAATPSSTEFDSSYFEINYRASPARDDAYERLAAMVRARFRDEAPRLLDVGCGTGGFLDAAAAKGFMVEGVDPSPEARRLSERDEFHAHFGLDEVAGQFDAVTLIDVVAHVDQPALLVRTIIGKLRAGGLLIVKTPNRPATLIRLEALLSRASRTTSSPLLHRRSQVHMFDTRALATTTSLWGLNDIAVQHWPEPWVRGRRGRFAELAVQAVQRGVAGSGSLVAVGAKCAS